VGDAVEAAIEQALRAAQARWPGVVVDAARFGGELRRRVPALTPAALANLCTDDVYLAIACGDGDSQAATHLERECFVEVDIAAKKLHATGAQTADMRSVLRQLLFPKGLADFTGRGDLRGYIKVIVTRELIRTINRERKEQPIETVIDRLEVERAPELSVLRARHGADITAALRAALAGLPERDRALLRYSLVDGWTVDQIGELYGVHRATAARWCAAARDGLGDRIRTEVASRLEISTDDVDSLIALVRSRIDVSLERIL